MSESDPPTDGAQAAPPADSPQLTPYEIPIEGSLGLLAAGYRGLIAWREKRDAAEERAAAKNQNG